MARNAVKNRTHHLSVDTQRSGTLAGAGLLGIAAPFCLAASTAFAQSPRSVPVVPVLTVNNAIGVNVHMEYTDGKYADVGTVLSDLADVGITRVRDGVPNPATWLPSGQGIAAMDRMAAEGIRFDLVVGATTKLSTDVQQIADLDAVRPGAVLSVEGPNEINNAPVHAAGLTNEQAATAFQRNLYKAVRGNPTLRSLPILYFTGGAKVNLAGASGLATVANTHQYPHNGEQPASWLSASWTDYFSMPRGYPWQLTETGYYTDPTSTDWGGVDADTQAKLLLNTLLDAARMGIQATYIYQLLDAYPYSDPRAAGADGHLGLFYYDGSPKPAATALRRMRMALNGAAGAVPSVKPTVTGLPSSGYALAMPKADGGVVIALWNEVPAWNSTTHQPLSPAAVPVTVEVPGFESAEVLDPVLGTTNTVARNGEDFSVKVPDYVILLMLRPEK